MFKTENGKNRCSSNCNKDSIQQILSNAKTDKQIIEIINQQMRRVIIKVRDFIERNYR